MIEDIVTETIYVWRPPCLVSTTYLDLKYIFQYFELWPGSRLGGERRSLARGDDRRRLWHVSQWLGNPQVQWSRPSQQVSLYSNPYLSMARSTLAKTRDKFDGTMAVGVMEGYGNLFWKDGSHYSGQVVPFSTSNITAKVVWEHFSKIYRKSNLEPNFKKFHRNSPGYSPSLACLLLQFLVTVHQQLKEWRGDTLLFQRRHLLWSLDGGKKRWRGQVLIFIFSSNNCTFPQVPLQARRRVWRWLQRRVAGWIWRIHWTTILPGGHNLFPIREALIRGNYGNCSRRS